MRKLLTLMILTLACAWHASALDVESTAGSLRQVVGPTEGVAELVVSGELDASDLDFIALEMPDLRRLDMSAARIVEYNGRKIRGFAHYDASLIPAHTFAGSCITEVILPGTERLTIGDAAFAGSALTSIEFAANVAQIGAGAFTGCQNLQMATVAAQTVPDGAFAACPKLEKVALTAAVVTIGENAFAGCQSLKEVSGSEAISQIGD